MLTINLVMRLFVVLPFNVNFFDIPGFRMRDVAKHKCTERKLSGEATLKPSQLVAGFRGMINFICHLSPTSSLKVIKICYFCF